MLYGSLPSVFDTVCALVSGSTGTQHTHTHTQFKLVVFKTHTPGSNGQCPERGGRGATHAVIKQSSASPIYNLHPTPHSKNKPAKDRAAFGP